MPRFSYYCKADSTKELVVGPINFPSRFIAENYFAKFKVMSLKDFNEIYEVVEREH